ncbi:MAG: aspartate 1-decarboxylase [Candidatus Cloacimonadaceae bacterium]|jgi:aspartate 1-decarboxylase|nr:aspartate 1-decarboxylase [Candidatus Cloacimonadota bacterium]
MVRKMLLSKLHRATVTECNMNYNASIKIDQELLKLSGMREYEQVEVWDINNGERFSTYIIPGEPGSRTIGIYGAAARKVQVGDIVIIANYGLMNEDELDKYQPCIILLDEHNNPLS